MEKLYVVVRADLSPGAQVAQSCHALRLFVSEHPEIDRRWFETSNNLVCLKTANEQTLVALADQARDRSVARSLVREPDFDDSATALTIEPAGQSLVSNLPLALRPEYTHNVYKTGT